jgi:hypothetical protein
VYAAGYQYGNRTFNYGNNVTSTGPFSRESIILVKYNASGTAQWARTASGSGYSQFTSVAVDSSGNVYAAGEQAGDITYDYGNNATVNSYCNGRIPLLVKYRE